MALLFMAIAIYAAGFIVSSGFLITAALQHSALFKYKNKHIQAIGNLILPIVWPVALLCVLYGNLKDA